jgi:GT2 family glycosyltransferase
MRLSLGIVTRNRPAYVARLLGAALNCEEPGADEIVVYDNSDNDLTESIVSRLSHVRYIRGRKRQAGGQNEILHATNSDILALLDDDSLPGPSYFRILRDDYALDSEGTVACVGGPAITVSSSGVPTVNIHSGTGFNRVLDGRVLLLTADHSPCWIPGEVCDVDIVRGANMSFRVGLLRAVGGFDEIYERGTWGEETDPQLALRRQGYRILYDPRLRVDHYMAKSGGNRSLGDPHSLGKIAYGNARNQVYLLRKHRLLTSRYALRWLIWSLSNGAGGLREELLSGVSISGAGVTQPMTGALNSEWQAFLTKSYRAIWGWGLELVAPSQRHSSTLQ